MNFEVGKYYKWIKLKYGKVSIIKVVDIVFPYIYYSYPLINEYIVYNFNIDVMSNNFVEINLTTKEYLRLKYEK